MKLLVSSCLAGLKVRYNGTDSLDTTIRDLVEQGIAVTVCPELLGGFTTPREPAEIVGGLGDDVWSGGAQVIEKSGRDVTDMYRRGALVTVELARKHNATHIVLKEGSPSCGSSFIYDGTFQNTKQSGYGVTTALLRREGYEVLAEHELAEWLQSKNFRA
ncbi:DUF523 domain-containing protein [Paenibacillus paeoniae]|uniref:DUF523 domain-containing protein n=1 Tax=Paenibacillus paeoniae TaxID=2292705 RepID=A0A371PNT7_9BACL|nr:DUF523 domain-containing protein [Paenibacillus paeoniae]REK77866.1 DUF523 domain-containing protein [Paenibacillus paeoniae]